MAKKDCPECGGTMHSKFGDIPTEGHHWECANCNKKFPKKYYNTQKRQAQTAKNKKYNDLVKDLLRGKK